MAGRDATVSDLVEWFADYRRSQAPADEVRDRAERVGLRIERTGSEHVPGQKLSELRLLRGDVLEIRDVPQTSHAPVVGPFLIDLDGPCFGRVIGMPASGWLEVMFTLSNGQPPTTVLFRRVDAYRIEVVSNGTLIDIEGHPVDGSAEAGAGDTIRIPGFGSLRVETSTEDIGLSSSSQMPFSPRTNLTTPAEDVEPLEVALPSPPRAATSRLSVGLVTSAVVGGGLAAALLGRPLFILLALAPIVAGSTEYGYRRLQHRRAQVRYARASTEVAEETAQRVAEALQLRSRNLYLEHPAIEVLAHSAIWRSPAVWSRGAAQAEPIQVSVGSTELAPDSLIPNELRASVLPLLEGCDRVAAPALVDLNTNCTIMGPESALDEVISETLLRLGVLYPPSELQIIIAADVPAMARVNAAAWLPHLAREGRPERFVTSAEQLLAELDRLEPDLESNLRSFIFVHSSISTDPTVLSRLAKLDSKTVTTVWFGPRGAQRLSGNSEGVYVGERELRASGLPLVELRRTTPLSIDKNEAAFRSLAPLFDPADKSDAGSDLPTVQPLRATLEAASRYRAAEVVDSFKIAVGVDTSGVTTIDLATIHHALIGGTTGAGKSELLQTIVASAVSAYPPSEVCVFLVDFKGGATIAPFSPLPHVCGFVTNLSKADVDRALDFLSAEVVRRQQLLSEADSPDYSTFRQHRELPRLLVVIDEFASLVESFEGTEQAIVRIAQQGRSLGVHIVLATQRPSAKVVSSDIQANVGLRISLRTATPADTEIVLGTKPITRLGRDSIGRAILFDGEKQTIFQAAYGGYKTQSQPKVQVYHLLYSDRPLLKTEVPTADESDLEAVIRKACKAVPPTSETQPILHPAFGSDALPLPLDRLGEWTGGLPNRISIGVLDDASRQKRHIFAPDLAEGGALLVGRDGTGKSHALLAAVSAIRAGVEGAVIIGIEAMDRAFSTSGRNTEFDVIESNSDQGNLELLMRQVTHKVRTRVESTTPEAPIYLIVDDVRLLQDAGDDGGGVLAKEFVQAVRAGRRHGLYVLAGSQTEPRPAFAAIFGWKLYLEPESSETLFARQSIGLPTGVASLKNRGLVKLFSPPADVRDIAHGTVTSSPGLGRVPQAKRREWSSQFPSSLLIGFDALNHDPVHVALGEPGWILVVGPAPKVSDTLRTLSANLRPNSVAFYDDAESIFEGEAHPDLEGLRPHSLVVAGLPGESWITTPFAGGRSEPPNISYRVQQLLMNGASTVNLGVSERFSSNYQGHLLPSDLKDLRPGLAFFRSNQSARLIDLASAQSGGS